MPEIRTALPDSLAGPKGTMLHDCAEMKELQVTLTRPVHYP